MLQYMYHVSKSSWESLWPVNLLFVKDKTFLVHLYSVCTAAIHIHVEEFIDNGRHSQQVCLLAQASN